jgi:hypothetical protein
MFENIIIHTENIKYTVLIIFLASIGYFLWKYYGRPSYVIPDKYKNKILEIFYKFLIVFTIIVLAILPLNPQYVIGKQIKKEKTLNIQFLFDVSLSMTAKDIKPYRFEAAKQTLIDLVEKLQGYNISVIFFSGIPFI